MVNFINALQVSNTIGVPLQISLSMKSNFIQRLTLVATSSILKFTSIAVTTLVSVAEPMAISLSLLNNCTSVSFGEIARLLNKLYVSLFNISVGARLLTVTTSTVLEHLSSANLRISSSPNVLLLMRSTSVLLSIRWSNLIFLEKLSITTNLFWLPLICLFSQIYS